MDDGIFQWDDAKAIANVERHGVTFEAAREAFKDPFALDWLNESEDYGDDRLARTTATTASPSLAWPRTVCCLSPTQ